MQSKEAGFTLLELLVVLIIIGVLAAIAIPTFLNAAARARQAQAKIYVGSVNRAQQYYRLENASFATTIADLQVGIPAEDDNYFYGISVANQSEATFEATAKDPVLRSFVGTVTNQSSISCQTAESSIAPATTVIVDGQPTCGPGSEPME